MMIGYGYGYFRRAARVLDGRDVYLLQGTFPYTSYGWEVYYLGGDHGYVIADGKGPTPGHPHFPWGYHVVPDVPM